MLIERQTPCEPECFDAFDGMTIEQLCGGSALDQKEPT